MIKIPEISPRIFWMLAITLHLLGFAQALHSGSIYLVDSIDYLSQAYNIKAHQSLYAAPWDAPLKPDYFSFRPPVYGLLIFAIKLFIQTDYAILFLQMLISLSTLWGVLKLAAAQGFAAGKSRSILLLTLIVYPSQIIHCNFVMSDILFQALLFWAFYFTLALWQNPNLRAGVWASLFFALAMLTKPVAFLLGISLAGILLLKSFREINGSLLRKSLLPFLLLPLVYHGYSSYNKHITGYYHYSSVTPIFVLKYMAKYTNAQLHGEAYADSVQDVVMAGANTAGTYAERYQWMNTRGAAMIAEHPLFFTWFNIRGWMALLVDPGRFEWVHFLNLSEGNYLGLYHVIHTQGLVNGLLSFMANAPLLLLAILALCFCWNLFTAVSLLRFLIQASQNKVLRICVFLFVAYILASTGVLGLSRYRVGIAPMLWLSVMALFASVQKDTHGV